MKRIKQTLLEFKTSKSIKVYTVLLIKLAEHNYLVNFHYGNKGSTLREGTKTTSAVDIDEAEQCYNSLVVSKINKGFSFNSGFNPLTGEDSTRTNQGIKREVLNTPDAQKEQLLDLLAQACEDNRAYVHNYKVSRLIYRAAHLHVEEAVAFIIRLFRQNASLEYRYSVLYALGKISNEEALSFIQSKRDYFAQDLEYLVDEIYLVHNIETSYTQEKILERLHVEFQGYIKEDDYTSLREKILEIEALEEENSSLSFRTLKQYKFNYLYDYLYQLSHEREELKALVYEKISQKPFTCRRIYKLAEFRDDMHTMARFIDSLEAKKMSCSTSYYSSYMGCDRNYFRRRFVRTLKDLHVRDAFKYLSLAKEILLQLKENKANYYSHLSLHFILHHESSRVNLSAGRHHYIIDVPLENKRLEAYPATWDKYPEIAFDILISTKLSMVHEFSRKILDDNSIFFDSLSLEQLVQLLQVPFLQSARLAFDRLTSSYLQTNDSAFIIAMFKANFEVLQKECISIVSKQTSLYQDAKVVAYALLSSKEHIMVHFQQQLYQFNDLNILTFAPKSKQFSCHIT